MREQIRSAILMFVILSLLTGIFYPAFITGAVYIFFPHQATGSMLYRNNKLLGSVLIGQEFTDPKYFWGRISETSPVAYNSSSSSGSNLGPSNPALIEKVKARIRALKEFDPDNTNPVPIDLVTSSASGLDPHISIAGAYYQIPRVARMRSLTEDTIKAIVNRHTNGRIFGLIGEPVVNVLELNLELDSIKIK
ncbi:MAG: potassium-transporting ATPase subunit C [Actinobacteria bacterium RBG_13_35_12]|nr:MAG: potassium-transporting ATPase subunit C [Actinobacteria bacterium RBG_13_35_12]